mmetsp:Transcript_84143/g.255358  ORF Transcript_84143/g.255358 Transcript_84143/m.255358 type:complete len:473 (-) Transcript_84143:104-1522(-)
MPGSAAGPGRRATGAGAHSDANDGHVLVTPPLALDAGAVVVVVRALPVPLALAVLALEALAVDEGEGARALHPVVREAPPETVAGGVGVGARAVLLAVLEVTLVAVPVGVVEGALAVLVAALELAVVPAAGDGPEGAVAVHSAILPPLPNVLIGLPQEGLEPLVHAAAPIALQVEEPPEVQLHLRDVAVDPEVDDHVHVATCAGLHEAVLDALHEEVGALAAHAEVAQHRLAVVGVPAQALQDLQHLLDLVQAVGDHARAEDVAAVPEVVVRKLLRVALDGLAPEPPGPLHAPAHLLRGAHGAGQALAEAVQELQALHAHGVGGAHVRGLLGLQAPLLQLVGRGQGPEALEVGRLLPLLLHLLEGPAVCRGTGLHGLSHLGHQLPVRGHGGAGHAEVLQGEVSVEVLPALQDVAPDAVDPLHVLGVVRAHGVHGGEAPGGARGVAMQGARALARDDALLAGQPPLHGRQVLL